MTDNEPGSAVALQGDMNLGDLMEVSRIMAVSSLLPQALRGKPADVLITLMYGQELGMSRMESILGIYVVNGRPGLSGQKWLERIRNAGHRMYIPCVQCEQAKREHAAADHKYVADHDEKHCTVTIVRGDNADEHTETFTWADAERAKLTGKDVWKSWPKRMLLWRATTTCATVICPEVASGFEMAEAMVDETAPVRPTLAQVAAEREDRRTGKPGSDYVCACGAKGLHYEDECPNGGIEGSNQDPPAPADDEEVAAIVNDIEREHGPVDEDIEDQLFKFANGGEN